MGLALGAEGAWRPEGSPEDNCEGWQSGEAKGCNLETGRNFTETAACGDIANRKGAHTLVDLGRRVPGKMTSPVASFPVICTDGIQNEGKERNKELFEQNVEGI